MNAIPAVAQPKAAKQTDEQKELAALRAELAKIKADKAEKAANRKIEFKIGQAGGLVIRVEGYRYPLNFFREQVDIVFAEGFREKVLKYVAEHEEEFKRKGF
jgi:RNase P/RNase MRP subunit p30